MKILWSCILCLSIDLAWCQIRVGSKNFTESYVLAEIVAQNIESNSSIKVDRKFGLGGTGLVFDALVNEEIDLYPEYTGTIAEAILKNPNLVSLHDIRTALMQLDLVISEPLGFNNTYALAVRRSFAKKHQLEKMSDLVKVARNAKFGFTHEFMSRSDGFASMSKAYDLKIPHESIIKMEHALVYEAIEEDQIDVIEVYSTDAKLFKLDLKILVDDQQFFPKYEAVILSKASFAKDRPKEWASIQELGNSIDESQMQMLNAKAEIDKESFSSIASSYLDRSSKVDSSFSSGVRGLIKNTKEHLFLVIVSLGIAIIVGVPLGIFADRHRLFGQLIMIVVGLFQTIPSLALLCFLIPLFGIGTLPALIALFLYALLPIVLSTYEALRSVSQSYRDSAKTLGLTFMRRLYLIYLPMTSSQILMGIKTSTIICIGTATLAALIGAGGYGVPIVTGLALNDSKLVLMGAIPAAAMALMTHLIFEAIKLILVPKGMRLRKTNV